MSTMPTRIDGELFEAARANGSRMSRSAAQQIAHWARLGRALEDSPQVSRRDVEQVLAGRAPYDALGEREQALVRAAWDDRIDQAAGALDLEAELTAAGDSWSEAGDDGVVVTRGPGADDR